MNGTHVNKLLVGKGKTYRLNHTELISVFHQDFDVFFLFLLPSRVTSRWEQSIPRKIVQLVRPYQVFPAPPSLTDALLSP